MTSGKPKEVIACIIQFWFKDDARFKIISDYYFADLSRKLSENKRSKKVTKQEGVLI